MKLIFILFAFQLFSSIGYSADKLTFRICQLDEDFSPFTNLKGDGLWQEKIKTAAKDFPVTLIFIQSPRKRCLMDVERGEKVDAIMGGVTVERRKYLDYPMKNATELDNSALLGTARFMVIVHKDSNVKWNGKKFENLGNGPLGVQRGFLTEEYPKNIYIEDSTSVEQNLKQVNMGRLKAAVIVHEQFSLYSKRSQLKNVKELPIPFSVKEIYLAVSKDYYRKNKKIIDKIWDNLKKK